MTVNPHLARSIVKDYYEFDGDITPLAGEVDLNFLVVCLDGSKYLLKICKPDVPLQEVAFQISIIDYLNDKKIDFDIPSIIPNKDGNPFFELEVDGFKCFVRLHSWVDGRMLSEVNPRSARLFHDWGKVCGALSDALQSFDHPGAHRFDKWNPKESLHSRQFSMFIEDDQMLEVAEYFWDLFESNVLPVAGLLRHSVNYSDAHEHNLLLHKSDSNQISGVIDFGDAIYAPTICELAIACAYAGMYREDPLESMALVVAGYNERFELEDQEVEALFLLICGRLLVTVTSAAHNQFLEPENDYLQISGKPARDLLFKLKELDLNFAHYTFRSACGWEAHPRHSAFLSWLESNHDLMIDPINLEDKRVEYIDLSVGCLDLGSNENFETVPKFETRINNILSEYIADIGIGGYGEVRPFYTTDAYKQEGNNGPRWRTMHLGKDYWTNSGTPVFAVYDGKVHSIQNNDNECDYGPTIILEHMGVDELVFYTLYGHLSEESLSIVSVGDSVTKGDQIASIGEGNINGGWPPHLHFQVMLDLMGNTGDFPGVCYTSESKVWLSICPSIDREENYDLIDPKQNINRLINERKESLGKSLSVSYREPLHMVRGYKQYLYDVTGRRYLDTVNNVAHVGHEHPRVVRAASRQASILNTNTRYLHDNIIDYADQLLSKCPEGLDVVYFVNSGSEANELALRMAKIYSGQQDIIALESGYHGNTGACVDVSSYKFDGKGGQGAPEHTSIVPMPDMYRGNFENSDTAGRDYANYVALAIQDIKKRGRSIAGFIAESILSCGGQIVLPRDYLKEAYRLIRKEGGLCIADEVQVGFGRVGIHYWGFELQDVVPDIVTCGKPIGNGHPLGAVITSQKVADAFTNGMEYFNTYGGNPVSCAVGMEVMNIIESEELRENAKTVGNYLLEGLRALQSKYDIIGDVRGIGFFSGIELVKDRNSKEPAHEEATYLVNRMRDLGILMSTDGPLHNVIKMKPPMCFTLENVDELIMRLDSVLKEDKMKLG